MKYTIKIFFSEEDEGYRAIAEELDLISAFGKTEEALKERFIIGVKIIQMF